MSDWQRTLDFSPYAEQYDKGELSIQEFAKIVVKKLKSLRKFKESYVNIQLEEIILYFEDLVEAFHEESGERDFDSALNSLYDWGDISLDGKFGGKKVCYIKMR